MQLKHALTLSLALVLSPLLRASDLPAPLPEFMDQQQLTKWCADKEAGAKADAAAQDVTSQFYTGKPYDADAGGYIFKYRTYNPEMVRWTTADPSGFPDGPNGQIYVPNPTDELDATGLQTAISPTANTGIGGPTTKTITTASGITYTITDKSAVEFALPAANVAMPTLAAEYKDKHYIFTSEPTSVSVTVNENYAELKASPYGTLGGIYLNISASSTGGVDHFANIYNATWQGRGDSGPDSPGFSKPYTFLLGGGDQGNGTYTDTSAVASLTYATPGNPFTWTGTLYILQSTGMNHYNVIGALTYGYTITATE